VRVADHIRCESALVAIFAADVVGYAHAVYKQVSCSSPMPRTWLRARLLETRD
jgi:hypothetical protein